MKICTICKKKKSLQKFNKNKSKKDGYNNLCKMCSKKRSKQYYSENTDHHKKVTRIRANKRKINNRIFILNLLKNSKCIDCNNSDYRVLEFDHIKDKKINNVGTMVSCGWSLDSIKKEINKCEIVCANCHRIRTFSRSVNYRTK